MGRRRDQALLLGALLLIVASALLVAPPPEHDALDPRASSYRPAAPGALGLFATLEELGFDLDRRLDSWVAGEPLDRPLVLLAPSQSLTPLEVRTLYEWVEGGGALVYAASPGDPLLVRFGLALRPAGGAGQPERAAAVRSHRWTHGLREVGGFRFAFSDTSAALATATPLLVLPDGQVVAVDVPVGEGRLLAWSDVGPLSNGRLRESGAAVLFARAAADLSAADERRLVFDEYHHGYRAGAGVVSAALGFLRHTGPGRMTLQLAAVGVALLFLLGRRFGAPYAPPAARRRSGLEHAEALAGAYQAGGARLAARRLLVTGLARRLGRPLPASGAEREWLHGLSALPGARPFVDSMLEEWRRGPHLDLVALAAHADHLVSQTRPG